VEEGRKKLEVGEDRHGGCERYLITKLCEVPLFITWNLVG
jgi:hypothetical protein